MTDLATDVARYTNARPSPAAALLLSDGLLPQEPILAGVAGWDRLDRLILLLTPLRVVIVRDGPREQWVTPIGLEECTGWEINPGWAATTFHLGTHQGVVDVGRVDLTAARQFAFAVDHQLGAFGPAAMPPDIAIISDAFEGLVAAVAAARGSSPADEVNASRDAATVCLGLLSPVVRSTGALTLAMSFALNAWICMSKPEVVKRGGGANVRSLLSASSAAADNGTLTMFVEGSPEARARTLRAAQEVVTAFRAAVPITSHAHVAQYTAVAQQLHESAAALEPEPELSALPVLAPPAPVDVVAQLERLASLRDSGVITTNEFIDLKGRLLSGPY